MHFGSKDTAEQAKFRVEVRQWLDANLPRDVEYPAEMDELDDRVYPLAMEFRRKLAEKGWLFPGWPKEYGGGGLSPEEQAIIEEEFSRCTFPIVYDRGVILGPALLRVGTEEQKQKFLPLLARGKIIVWQCFTEPEAGTDLASLRLQAVQDGDEFMLNGQKTYSGDGRPVDYLYTLAITDRKAPRHANMSAILVKADSPGISMTQLKPIAGARKNTIYFENVRVPVENMIGELNKGWYVANISLASERAGWGGTLKLDALFDEFLHYCKETKRNGQPLSNDPHVRELLVDLYLDIRARDLLASRNSWKRRQGLPSTYEASQAALLMKVLLPKFAAVLLEIAGPYALVKDERWAILKGKVEHIQRRSLMTHGGGTPEAQKMVMARALGLGRR